MVVLNVINRSVSKHAARVSSYRATLDSLEVIESDNDVSGTFKSKLDSYVAI